MMKVLKGGGSEFRMMITQLGGAGGGPTGGNVTYVLPFTSESLNPTGEFINSNAITASRSRGVGDVGNRAADGSFETEVNFHLMPMMMYSVLGATSGTNIIPSDNKLPTYEVGVQHGASASPKITQFSDVLVNSLRFTWASNAIMTASFDIVGLVEAGSPAMPDTNVKNLTNNILLFPARFIRSGTGQSELKFDSGGDAVKLLDYALDFEFSIDNGIDVDTYALDASGRLTLVPGELAVTGSTTLLVPATGELRANLDALTIGSEWPWITLGIDNGATERHVIKLQNIYIQDISHDIADRGKVAYDIDFVAVFDGTKVDALDKQPILMALAASGTAGTHYHRFLGNTA